LPLYIEFGVPKGSIHELRVFMKKYKLVHRTILLNIIDFLLHHAKNAKSAKDIWDNLYATFERHVGNRLQVHQKLYNFKMEEGISMQAHNNKVHMILNQV
jgi:hypothetical protein